MTKKKKKKTTAAKKKTAAKNKPEARTKSAGKKKSAGRRKTAPPKKKTAAKSPPKKRTAAKPSHARRQKRAEPSSVEAILEIVRSKVDEKGLAELALDLLRKAGRALGLEGVSKLRKADLLTRIAEAITPPAEPEAPERREPRSTAPSRRSPEPEPVRQADRHAPWGYGLDRVGAMAVDPNRVFVYWEVTDDAIASARERLDGDAPEARLVVRLYDTTGRLFDGSNAHHHRDHPVDRASRQSFFDVNRPGSELFVELGLRGRDDRFQKIARSRRVSFPRLAAPQSSRTEWVTVLAGSPAGAAPHVSHPHASPVGPAPVERHPAAPPSRSWASAPEEGAREVTGAWTVVRSWTVAEGTISSPEFRRRIPGSSELSGASERRFRIASEARLGGASDRRLGASERRLGGASELRISQPGFPPILGSEESGS